MCKLFMLKIKGQLSVFHLEKHKIFPCVPHIGNTALI